MTKPTGKLAELAKIQRTGDRLILPVVQEHLLSRWGPDPSRDPCRVHVSEMAKKDWCERATFHRIRTGVWPEEKFNFTLSSIFDEGHQIHDKWQTWLAETGKLWGDWRCKICGEPQQYMKRFDLPRQCSSCLQDGDHWKYLEVSFYWGLISGHEDAAIDDRLVEFKSVGIGTLRRENPGFLSKYYVQLADGRKIYDLDAAWKNLKQPLMTHVRQANLYLWLATKMAEQGIPAYKRFTKCSIVYEYKPNQQSREFVIPLSMDIVNPLLDRVALIASGLKSGVAPPCPYGGCTQCQGYDDEVHTETRAARPRRLTHRRADCGDGTAAGVLRGGRHHP